MDKAELLKQKFIELGSTLTIENFYISDLLYNRWYPNSGISEKTYQFLKVIKKQTLFRQFILNSFDTNEDTYNNVSVGDIWVLKGLPFLITGELIQRDLTISTKTIVTFLKDRKTQTREIFYSADTKNIPKSYVGEMKKAAEKKCIEVNELSKNYQKDTFYNKTDRKNRIEQAEQDVSFGLCTQTKTNNDLVYTYNPQNSNRVINVYYYKLQYKDLWVILTKEEINQLLLEVETNRQASLLIELKELDTTPEKIDALDVTPWLIKNLEDLENKLRSGKKYL